MGRRLIGDEVLAAVTEIERLAELMCATDDEAAKDSARRIIAICKQLEERT